ncbi:uncharacterized protein LOC121736873 isoform X2 [Aricia agestis]|uniref:uncharacterized protein LOC121736873 isoform X2 n=1 Tax=Aricia agestis TaxID=91739 RepID=UPI001C204076|nr:uncharacterized protein LOC121736873 isoform X2 [Aricia agestis]
MADDIDIEEHDLMDNPQLGNIFPCITNIKSEVIDYEDENGYLEENGYMEPNKVIKKEPCAYESNPNINSNVIIFGTKPSTPQQCHKASTSANKESSNEISFENNDDDDDDDYIDGNDEDPDIKPCSVVLKDWHSFLINSSCYCSQCEILFPTPNAIESHRMTDHSFLVAVSHNKAIKSTSKGTIKDDSQVNRRSDLLCRHCNIFFPSENYLILHLNSLLPDAVESSGDEKPLAELADEEVLYATCPICAAYFKQEVTYRSHILLNHADRHLQKVTAPFNPKCRHCNAYTMNPKKYNCHLKLCHPEIYLLRNYEKDHYQCHICKQTFPTADTEWKHRLDKHPTNVRLCGQTFRKALTLGKIPPKYGKTLKPSACLKSNRLKRKKEDGNENITIVPKKLIVKKEPEVDNNKLVPKSNLFVCGKCKINFVSPSAAFEHTQHCTLGKGDWKCRPCRRSFTKADIEMHINQHKLKGRLRSIVISEWVLSKIINRCGKCNVCFDETTFSKYHGSGCKPCPSVECDVCHLRILKFVAASHSRAHSELGWKINDFIITDYEVLRSAPVLQNLEDDSGSKCDDNLSLSAPEGKIKLTRKTWFNRLYYCPNCKVYSTRHRPMDGHEKADCIPRKLARELCKVCGLVFTKKGYETHKEHHRRFNFKLHSLTFINIISGKKIIPPFPEFMLCSACRVYFVSRVALQNHACNAEENKSCRFCQKKFSDLALKLHVPFHQLAKSTTTIAKKAPAINDTNRQINCTIVGNKKSSPSTAAKNASKVAETRMPTPIQDLIKKYESLVTVWNILYRCRTCDIVYDSYDSTVEHCQDHFCNMESYNLKIKYCKQCDLKFVDECFGRHEHLHSQNSVTIESFVIVDCDYSLLLSDEWQTVFDKLSKDQLQQVMSKSIYNETRGVRMDLQCEGDLGYVYKCSICNLSVDLQSIVDHVKSRECSVEDVNFTCNVCNVGFRLKKTANAHKLKHELSGVPYRIVCFNDPKTLFIDEALIKSAKADDLKFIRCQFCGRLINKSLYKMHICKHNYRKKLKLLKSNNFKGSSGAVSSIKSKVSQSKIDQKSIYRYHVCVKCNVALLKNSHSHVCRDDQKKKCPKCRVFINAQYSSLYRHNKIHKNYPTLSHKTIKITYFNPDGIKISDNGVTKLKPTVLKPPVPVTVSTAVRPPQKLSKKIRFFRCVHCMKICTLQSSIPRHQCTPYKTVECELCGVPFDGRKYKKHLEMHNRISFTRKDVQIIPFDYTPGLMKPQAIERTTATGSRVPEPRSGIAGKPDYLRVYKCTECNLFFICRANLLEHLSGSQGACDPEAGERCEHCNLNFHSAELWRHKTHQFCKTRKISRINVCTLILKNTDPNDINNWLSYCKRCDLYHTNALKHHFDNNHDDAKKTVPCPKCGVRFANVAIRKHNIYHHGSVDIPFSDLNVDVMEDISLEEAGYALTTLSESRRSLRNAANENIADKIIEREEKASPTMTIKHQNKIQIIYRCHVCNLHFLHRASLRSHLIRDEHNTEKIPCNVCGRPFSHRTGKKHAEMHTFTSTFTVIDQSSSSWCDSSSTSLNTSETPDSAPMTSDSVSNDEHKDITFDTNMTTATATDRRSQSKFKVETREAADSSGTSSNEISSTSVSHAGTENEVRLFKCGQCDVYFLSAECCSYHTDNHSPLDPTEYIACKICDLQFLNRSLDVHMKAHREKTFSMETLVVDEYLPVGQSVKINTYSAIDRLKSKLVSTTTESD